MLEDKDCDEYAVNNQLQQYPKGGYTYQEKYWDKLVLLNIWHHFNV